MPNLVFCFGIFLPLLLTASSHAVILIFLLAFLLTNSIRRNVVPGFLFVLIPFVIAILVSGALSEKHAFWASSYVALQVVSWLAIAILMARVPFSLRLFGGLIWGIGLYIFANLVAIYAEPAGIRHSGLFPNANGLASTSACLFVVAHALGMRHRSKFPKGFKLLHLVCLAGLGVLVVLAGSRAGIFAAGVYLAFYGAMSPRMAVKGGAALFLVVPLIYFAGGQLVRDALIFKRVEVMFAEIFSSSGAADLEALEVTERVYLVDIALDGWSRSPFIGNGIGAFRDLSGYSYAHNTYADLLFSTGILGLLAYLFIIVSATYGYLRKRSMFPDVNGFFPVLVFIIFYSFFIPVYQIFPFSLVFGYLIGFSLCYSEIRDKKNA